MAAPKKTALFQVIASAEIGERIPRVPGAFHFALPFLADEAVDWSLYFAGVAPRAFLVSQYPALMADGTTPQPKEGLIYPLDLSAGNANLAYDMANYLGVVIDGHNYDQDLNITVTLAAGIPLRYLQGALASASETVDPLVEQHAEALGLKIFSQNVFWNVIQ